VCAFSSHLPNVATESDSSGFKRAMSQSFTKLDLYLCNKELDGQITLRWENESRCFVDCEPFKFSLKAPAFHRPCELNFCFESTTNDFRNLFSGVLESLVLSVKLTSLRGTWKKLITDYEAYLEKK